MKKPTITPSKGQCIYLWKNQTTYVEKFLGALGSDKFGDIFSVLGTDGQTYSVRSAGPRYSSSFSPVPNYHWKVSDMI